MKPASHQPVSSKSASSKPSSAKLLARSALFLAMTLILSYVEHQFGSLPLMPPGVKLGLSNVPVMYSLLFTGLPFALLLAVLKSLFVLLTRGFISGLLSLLGGLFSVLMMALLLRLFKTKISYLTLSVAGAVSHNLGQLVGACFFMGGFLWVYLPILILSGVLMGLLTGFLLKVVLPYLQHIGRDGL